MKTIPKLKTEKPTGVSLNDLEGGAIFLYGGDLYVKDIDACTGTNLLTGYYNEEINNAAIVEEVDATLTWQKKKPKVKPKKKKN